METKIKAVIFDCDGTLVDSEYSHYMAWVEALRSRGFELPFEDYNACVGKPDAICAQSFARKFDCHPPETVLRDKNHHFHQMQLAGLSPIQATVDFVHLLGEAKKRGNFKMGVASAAKKREILMNLKQLKIEQYFDVVLSGQDDLMEYEDPEGVNKPKPYIYLHAAKILGVAPGQCVCIEDSHPGVSSAVDAGCITIAVPNHFTQKQDLSRATFKIDSFSGMDVEQFFRLFGRG